MSKVSAEEVRKIAAMTKLKVSEESFDDIVAQLNGVLEYAERVQLIAKDVNIPSDKNINQERVDSVVFYDAAKVLKLAPQEEDGFFVVPKILDN